MQGGGMRGVFGAGVMYEFAKQGFFADIVAPVSASVPTAMYYASRQYEEMRRIWLEEVGTSRFVHLGNLFLGKPIYDIDYLIDEIFRKKYLLAVDAVVESPTRLIVPLFNYHSGVTELHSNHDDNFRDMVWALLHISMTLHDKHILWGTKFEQYVDAGIDPFVLYKLDYLPENTRVISIWNEPKFDMHKIKFLGQKLFLLLQSRNFPPKVKEMLRTRSELISNGMRVYNDYRARVRPIEVKPDNFSFLDGLDVLSRDNKHLSKLFEHGRIKARAALSSEIFKNNA